MTPDNTSSPPLRPLRRRGLRIVTVSNGHATAEDLVLDHAETTHRFGDHVAALIFDDQRPGTLDLTYRTAAHRYGAPAAALIFPAGAGTQAPTVNDTGDDRPLALPPVDRDVS